MDERALERLQDFADWMKFCSCSIYGCGAAPAEFPEARDCRYTYNAKEKKLYIHFMNWPFRYIYLRNLAGKAAYARFLHDGSEVKFIDNDGAVLHHNMALRAPRGSLTLSLPVVKPEIMVPVVELTLK